MLSATIKFTLAFLLLGVLGVYGFVIHEEHSANKALTSDLSDALKLLERQRRQLDTGYYRERNELPPLEYFGDRLPYPYDDADIPPVPSESYGRSGSQAPDSELSLDDLYRTLKSERENNEKETTSDEELNEIFNTQDNDNNSDNALDDSETKETDSKLIQQASKLVSPPAVDDNLEDTSPSKESENENIKPVSKEQLDSLFQNVDTESDDESETPTSVINTNVLPSSEEEPKTVEQIESSSKRMTKRGSPRDRIIQAKDEEIAALKEEIARLSIKEKLEDEEIDALAGALKKVTEGEISGADDIGGEFKDLEHAIKIEETLNSLTEIQSGKAFKNAGSPNRESKAVDTMESVKRQEQDFNEKIADERDESLGGDKWYDEPPLEDDTKLANIFVNQDEDAEPEDGVIQISSDRDVGNLIDDNEVTADEVRAAISELEPWEKVELAKDLAEIRDSERRPERLDGPFYRCPDMNSLTSNCDFADKNGIFMDEEARELCNRHEMCYACGSTFQISVYKCDAGYLGDAIEACDGVSGCVSKAEQFLMEMRTRHEYSPLPESYCSDRCIKDFIFGVA